MTITYEKVRTHHVPQSGRFFRINRMLEKFTPTESTSRNNVIDAYYELDSDSFNISWSNHVRKYNRERFVNR